MFNGQTEMQRSKSVPCWPQSSFSSLAPWPQKTVHLAEPPSPCLLIYNTWTTMIMFSKDCCAMKEDDVCGESATSITKNPNTFFFLNVSSNCLSGIFKLPLITHLKPASTLCFHTGAIVLHHLPRSKAALILMTPYHLTTYHSPRGIDLSSKCLNH